MRRVGEESTRGVGIPGESVPCSPRLHGFSARACVSLFAKPLRVGEEDFAFPFLFFPLSFQLTRVQRTRRCLMSASVILISGLHTGGTKCDPW